MPQKANPSLLSGESAFLYIGQGEHVELMQFLVIKTYRLSKQYRTQYKFLFLPTRTNGINGYARGVIVSVESKQWLKD